MTITLFDFEKSLHECGDISYHTSLAVAVSGGPDSMALLWFLMAYTKDKNLSLNVYTVDHGLRPESASEAQMVEDFLKGQPYVHHKILKWDGNKPSTRLLEEARKVRYRLLIQAAQKDGCDCLFVAHHRDDQAETFLMRLSKGSGLDGLCGMSYRQNIETDGGQTIVLLRPLLDFSKQDLMNVCNENKVPFAIDPTNENKDYMRPRLRSIYAALEEEGLSAKRLATTAKRVQRAKSALEEMSKKLFNEALSYNCTNEYKFNYNLLKAAPEELRLRVILMTVEKIFPQDDYGPRLERIENLTHRIFFEPNFKSATLSGCLFTHNQKEKELVISKEAM